MLDHLEADSSDSSSGPSDDESSDDDFTKPAPPPPLPKGWLARIDADGQRFFENLLTGETSWHPPAAETAPAAPDTAAEPAPTAPAAPPPAAPPVVAEPQTAAPSSAKMLRNPLNSLQEADEEDL